MNVLELIKEKLEEIIEEHKEFDERTEWHYERNIIDIEYLEDFIDEVAQEYNNGWIPCSERLPELYTSVLVCEENGEIHLCSLHNNNRFYYDGSDWDIKLSEVTHWQPLPTLPAPYKEGGTE